MDLLNITGLPCLLCFDRKTQEKPLSVKGRRRKSKMKASLGINYGVQILSIGFFTQTQSGCNLERPYGRQRHFNKMIFDCALRENWIFLCY